MSAISMVLEKIKKAQSHNVLGEEVFYRGQREKQVLVPSLLRKDKRFKHSIFITENNIFCDAWVMGANELGGVQDSWEALALFQHYEIPTRLLDWSSSLTSALFFALLKCLKCGSVSTCKNLHKTCDGNPTIWVLDPHKMHQALHPSDPVKDSVAITVGVDQLQDYKVEFVAKDPAVAKTWKYTNGPVFLEIPWRNARIRSQKGFFTFHPDDTPLENQLGTDGRKGLLKIAITKSMRTDIVGEFSAMGTNEHDIFTDLVSLANYFRRRYSTI